MPRFKTTNQILKVKEEFFNLNWTDKPFIDLPPIVYWDYKRDLKIEDIDIWEVIWESGGGNGVYASWMPYAEFYIIVISDKVDSTYYGKGSDKYAAKRLDELKIPYSKKNGIIK